MGGAELSKKTKMSILHFFTLLLSKVKSFLRLQPENKDPILFILEQYAQDLDVTNVSLGTPDLDIQEIATELELSSFSFGITTLPEPHSWRGLAESLASSLNPDLEDLVRLTYIHQELMNDPYGEIFSKALEIITVWGPAM